MSAEQIKHLEELIQKHREQISNINKTITELRDIPYAKSLIGKYFVRFDISGPMFIEILSIKNDTDVVCNTFAVDNNRIYSIELNQIFSLWTFNSAAIGPGKQLAPITKIQYLKEKKKFLKELNKKFQ